MPSTLSPNATGRPQKANGSGERGRCARARPGRRPRPAAAAAAAAPPGALAGQKGVGRAAVGLIIACERALARSLCKWPPAVAASAAQEAAPTAGRPAGQPASSDRRATANQPPAYLCRPAEPRKLDRFDCYYYLPPPPPSFPPPPPPRRCPRPPTLRITAPQVRPARVLAAAAAATADQQQGRPSSIRSSQVQFSSAQLSSAQFSRVQFGWRNTIWPLVAVKWKPRSLSQPASLTSEGGRLLASAACFVPLVNQKV